MSDAGIRATKLASALGQRLATVVPVEVEVSVAGTVVSLRMRGTPWGMDADLRALPHGPRPVASDDLSGGLRDELVVVTDEPRRAIASEPAQPSFVEIEDVVPLLESVLDQFQDEVAETVTEPWPAVARGPMPEPFVELRGGRLLAGYGDPAEPALTLLSVALQDLR
jgi:hypothetical protein